MRLSEKERAANRAAFRAMSLGQKAEYVLAYYKLPLVLVLVALVALVSVARYYLAHKNALLYVAYANVELPEEDDARIFDGYLSARGANPRSTEVYRYRDLYLSDPEDSVDHQYSYASRLKLLAATDAEELDVVLMSQESYDLLSHSGFLIDLDDALTSDADLRDKVSSLLAKNDVIVSDNQIDYELGEADTYEAVTEVRVNAIDVTDLPVFADTTLSGKVYLGIIGNTPRLDEAMSFVRYLTEAS